MLLYYLFHVIGVYQNQLKSIKLTCLLNSLTNIALKLSGYVDLGQFFLQEIAGF